MQHGAARRSADWLSSAAFFGAEESTLDGSGGSGETHVYCLDAAWKVSKPRAGGLGIGAQPGVLGTPAGLAPQS